MKVIYLNILACLTIMGGPFWEASSQEAAVEFLNIPYSISQADEQELLSLDIYTFRDVEVLKPVVIYFHGGAWSIGDKSRKIEDKIRLFHRLGYVFVSANYRLSPFPARPGDPDRIKFPLHNRDVAWAIRWVHDSIHKYGGDQEKIVLMGHSAGAHLVSLTGTNERFLKEAGMELSDIDGIISLDSACYDVEEMVRGRFQRLYINAFGIDPGEMKEASPLHHISDKKDHPPFLIVKRGSGDRQQKIEEFVNSLENNRVKVLEINADIYTHSGVNNAIGDEKDNLITPAIIEFLNQCFDG